MDLDSQSSGWVGAKSCFHRSPYSSELAPPTDSMEEACRRYGLPHPPSEPPKEKEVLRGCGSSEPVKQGPPNSSNGQFSIPNGQSMDECKIPISSTSLGSASFLESPPTPANGSSLEPPPTPVGLEEVKYEVLEEATAGFDRTPYKEGGHKVGEGGFGEVFQCSLVLQGGPVHAAVKVLLNKVRAGMWV